MLPVTARTWSVFLTLACATASEAGVIRGTVRVPAASSKSARALHAYPGRAGSLPHDGAASQGSASDAIVSIERIPAAVESLLMVSPRPTPRLAQKNQNFVPHVLAIAAGTTVEFPNLDPIFHNVFSVSSVRRFDLGKYPRGQSRSVTFSKTGLVEVYCDIHADMAAFVVVLPNHAFAQADDRGRFELPDLPPGEYSVRVWHPDWQEMRRSVIVPGQGDVEIEIEYGGKKSSSRAAESRETGEGTQ